MLLILFIVPARKVIAGSVLRRVSDFPETLSFSWSLMCMAEESG